MKRQCMTSQQSVSRDSGLLLLLLRQMKRVLMTHKPNNGY